MNRQVFSLAKAVLAPKQGVKINSIARNSSHYKPPANWYEPTMNELPVPTGSWQAAYDAQQKKNNLHLIVGVSFFAFTLFTMKASGLIVLNSTIPKLPDDM
ncbi:uncharacterized protein LOC110851320 [Folsomia candida]|uniref:uncharacterized protein LOC110851320 n=1 Tax=Folsomia candida TaxID=158441 RepID=UPI000B8F766F|nr:uncharacterized protein LOC110851320 [Folsomia candida]